MTSDERERVKRSISEYLCSDPSPWQAELVNCMIDTLGDDHLMKLDGMVHETDEQTDW